MRTSVSSSQGSVGVDLRLQCAPDILHGGLADNYQCNHYEKALSVPRACEDAGKIILHAFRKKFAPPRQCSFVAPSGPETALRDMLLNPDKFQAEVIATWNTRVAKKVVGYLIKAV